MKEYSKLQLGTWKLNDLVKDPNSSEFQEFLSSIDNQVKEFESCRGELQNLSGVRFAHLINLSEEIYEKLSVASGYAHLKYYSNTASNDAAALVTKIEKMASDISNRLLFFDLWFKKEINDQIAGSLINSVDQVYKEHLNHKRLLAKYTLSEPEEKILNTTDVTGSMALVKIYDKMTSGFEFEMIIKSGGGRGKAKGKKVIRKNFANKEKVVTFVRSPRKEEREAAYKSLWKTYKKNSGVLGEIYQNLVLKWRDEYISMRGFNSPISVRNIFNNLEDQTVQSLLDTCRKNSYLFHRYFKEKARILHLRKLQRYDLYAPMITDLSKQKKFSYGKAAEMVLRTFEGFSPEFKKYAQRVFDEEHVDSEIRNAKRGGAFCYTVSPKRTPYVLLNYDKRARDVSTLAHEFGHAIHSMAAADKPLSVSHASLPLAETASVFAEMLLNENLALEMSPNEYRILLAEQIDDLYATIMRQAYFTLFEIEAHRAIAQDNATIDQVSEIYFENLKEQFGNSVSITDDFKWEWTYIPHFYHTPFYCYAYSFGNLLVMALYQQYKTEGQSFIPKYFKVLSAGGSKKPETILSEIGIDITRQEFWQQGFDLVERKINELENLGKKKKQE